MLAILPVAGCDYKGEATMRYSYNTTTDPGTGWEVVELRGVSASDPAREISVKICPSGGNNLYALRYDGHDLIYGPEDLGDFYRKRIGTPVLYPTPNRVTNGTFTFMGETVVMQVPGEEKPRTIHGLVYDDVWKWTEPEITDNGVVLHTWYDFTEDNPRFNAFPFLNTIRMDFDLSVDGVRISYEVENRDTRPMGFGFALHPYWHVIGGKDKTRIQVDVPWHMEAVEKYPTGSLEAVQGTGYDLTQPRPVSELALDDVYFGATPNSMVRVLWDDVNLELRQTASEDFTHVVVFTPDAPFFCIENQTCSTNAHNLYTRGFTREAHLQTVEAGDKTGGYVDYTVHRTSQ